jgi:hypothetical protein
MPDALIRLRERCAELEAVLGSSIPLRTTPQHDGSAHVEEEGGVFAYVVTERGQEYERRLTRDEDDLLYWVVADETFELAGRYELQHRVPGQDSRRVLFQRELELLRRLSPAWSDRKRAEIDAILKEHPYSA